MQPSFSPSPLGKDVLLQFSYQLSLLLANKIDTKKVVPLRSKSVGASRKEGIE